MTAPTAADDSESNALDALDALEEGATVYMDGVWDLFHVGHLRAIQRCREYGQRVVIGVVSDADCAEYKRVPHCSQSDRAEIVRAIRGVDDVICPCPLRITDAFMDERKIDLVVHGFKDERDYRRQADFFAVPLQRGLFRRVLYTPTVSTSAIIDQIQTAPRSEAAAAPNAPKE